MSVIGYPYSGKSTHIGRLRTRYDLEIIDIKELAESAVKDNALAGGALTDE